MDDIPVFALLILVTTVSVISQAREQPPPLMASFSNAPDGARALRLWLEELGYPTSDQVIGLTFRLPEEAALSIMLEPQPGITPQEWQVIDEWVEEGGTLILAGHTPGAALAVRHYDFNLLYRPDASTVYNVGMCHYGLGHPEDALAWVTQTLEIDPSFDAAREMRQELRAELDAAPTPDVSS